MAGMATGATAGLMGLALGTYGLIEGQDVERREPHMEAGQSLAVQRMMGDEAFAQQQLQAIRDPYVNQLRLENFLLGGEGGSQRVSWNRVHHLGGGRFKKVPFYYDIDLPESRGYLNLLREDLLPAQDAMALESLGRQARGSLDLVNQLGPQALEAYRSTIDPKRTALLNQLTDQVSGEVAAGPGLDPALRREFTQGVRGAQSARGMGFGMNDAYEEAYTIGMAGEQRRRDRQNAALNVLRMHGALEPDLVNMILGRPGQVGSAQAMGMGAYGPSQGSQATPWSPQSFENAYDFNANSQAAANIGEYNALMGMSSGLIQGGLSLMGSSVSAG